MKVLSTLLCASFAAAVAVPQYPPPTDGSPTPAPPSQNMPSSGGKQPSGGKYPPGSNTPAPNPPSGGDNPTPSPPSGKYPPGGKTPSGKYPPGSNTPAPNPPSGGDTPAPSPPSSGKYPPGGKTPSGKYPPGSNTPAPTPPSGGDTPAPSPPSGNAGSGTGISNSCGDRGVPKPIPGSQLQTPIWDECIQLGEDFLANKFFQQAAWLDSYTAWHHDSCQISVQPVVPKQAFRIGGNDLYDLLNSTIDDWKKNPLIGGYKGTLIFNVGETNTVPCDSPHGTKVDVEYEVKHT